MEFDSVRQPMSGLLVMYPKVFEDDRGCFLETFSDKDMHNMFNSYDLPTPEFVQENESKSTNVGTLRGIHLQQKPFEQGKLVRVINGKVLDVVVDLRPDSKTFGQHYSVILDEYRKNMMYIPEGFGHGFITLVDNTTFTYKCTNYYNKESEYCIKYDDADLNIDWEYGGKLFLSDKDLEGKTFKEFKTTI